MPQGRREYTGGKVHRPRRHHFVPRFYLEGFCADDERALAVYDRIRNEYREQRPA
ncbi:DUF4238 domain-containing protein [Burkholderia cepacia]|uniref:DUF4238 domain-containing protein n=1 Tax=Burkholderia cepacia TaxID=292 RepID=A0AAQ0F4K4_BURCE|nr:DUF4238 domain-containing protein [Burkholderia cepacia]